MKMRLNKIYSPPIAVVLLCAVAGTSLAQDTCLDAGILACDFLEPQTQIQCLDDFLDFLDGDFIGVADKYRDLDLGTAKDAPVTQDLDAEGYEINNSLSGTWYDPNRDGEGFMIDVANHGVVVVSYYTYDNSGRQFWLIGTGNVDGSIVEIDFFSTDGGIYGEDYDPATVTRYAWGTGILTFTECSTGFVEIRPNPDFIDEFEALDLQITRLTVPVNCGGG